ncbi:MAG: S9 family peptidase [Bdellovibrio sp.]|nr:S9 family peptidase [Bdellovibrio sp.]
MCVHRLITAMIDIVVKAVQSLSADLEFIMNAEYIPREVLFSNPDIAQIRISPDGKYVAYLAESNGFMNVWVQEFGKPETAKVLTKDTKRGITMYHWTYAPGILIYDQDANGDENYGLCTVNVVTGEVEEITKPGHAATEVNMVSHLRPNEVIIMTNARDPNYFDFQILDLTTKTMTLLFENSENLAGVAFDKHFNPVMATKANGDGSSVVLLWDKLKKSFVEMWTILFEDSLTTWNWRASIDGEKLYWIGSQGRDKAALQEWDLKTDVRKIVSASEKADIDGYLFHPEMDKLLFSTVNYLKREFQFHDEEFKSHFKHLQSVIGEDINITSMSHNAEQWVVTASFSDKPVAFYFYDVKTKKAGESIIGRKSLAAYTSRLNPMQPVEIKARDGLTLVSYFTKAKNSADNSLVLLVHGGPWHRDTYGYNSHHQWFSDRGYNVLSVNFRGSTGFGKAFISAGNHEWGRNMHNDLIDGVNWAIANGHADPKKVAIVGASYGGYSALAGITFTPDVFAASVDIVGPSNLETLLTTFPPYWKSFMPMFYRCVGDPTTEEGRKLLKERSPLNHVDKIKTPLLILQGANDPRVKKAEADQIYNSMVAKKIPVEYVVFPDEGHGFVRALNNMGANALVEEFLGKYLKGRVQPIGDHVKRSSAQFIMTPQ